MERQNFEGLPVLNLHIGHSENRVFPLSYKEGNKPVKSIDDEFFRELLKGLVKYSYIKPFLVQTFNKGFVDLDFITRHILKTKYTRYYDILMVHALCSKIHEFLKYTYNDRKNKNDKSINIRKVKEENFGYFIDKLCKVPDKEYLKYIKHLDMKISG